MAAWSKKITSSRRALRELRVEFRPAPLRRTHEHPLATRDATTHSRECREPVGLLEHRRGKAFFQDLKRRGLCDPLLEERRLAKIIPNFFTASGRCSSSCTPPLIRASAARRANHAPSKAISSRPSAPNSRQGHAKRTAPARPFDRGQSSISSTFRIDRVGGSRWDEVCEKCANGAALGRTQANGHELDRFE